MFRHQNDTNYMISPIKGSEDIDNSTHTDIKKSRNRHLVIINQLRRKEDAWDGRFQLGNIPEYNCVDDRYCETYKRMLVKKKSRKFVLKKEKKGYPSVESTGKPRSKIMDDGSSDGLKRPDSYDKPTDLRLRGIHPRDLQSRGQSRGDSMRRHTPILETLLKEKRALQEKLLAIWERLNTPLFHREAFLKCENAQNLKQTIEILKKEIEELEHNCSPIQLALRAVTARENCLKHLRVLMAKFENKDGEGEKEPINEEESKQKASELLTHLRILSLNAVETILKWREYIQQTYYITRGVVKANQTILIPFLFQEINYLLKMKNDTRELVESPLAKFFNFSSKSDPFLVYPSKELQQTDDKIVLYISKNLINRIRACELVILEESVHEHINDKNTSVNPHSNSKTFENPSDRSLQKEKEETPSQQQQKKPAIKIRKTSVVNPKEQKRTPSGTRLAKAENETKGINKSQPASQNLATEGEDKKKEDNQPKQDNHAQPTTEKQKSPAKNVASPKKEAVTQEAPKENKESTSHAAIRPLDLYEDQTEGYLKTYLEKLDKGMHDSFLSDPKILLERANMGQDPMWFELVDGGKPAGLAVAHIDNTAFTSRRLVILHFTAENRELYQVFLGKFVEHLWKTDECSEIKISLYYLEDQNNNLGADKQLQESIKKLGFRWKQLTNDKYTGKRYIDYSMKRPEGVVCTGVKNKDEPIHVKSCVVISDLQGEVATNKHPKHNMDNRFAVLNAALKHCEEKIDKLGDIDTKRGRNYLQSISSLIKEGASKKIGDVTGKFENHKDMEAFVTEKLEDEAKVLLPTIDAKYANNKFTTSLLNLIYRWKSYNITHHSVSGKDRKYLKINNNNELMQFQSKHLSSSVYFIPTDDNEVNIFLTDNDAIVKSILNKEEIIEETVSKLFSKLEKTPTPFSEDLWLPLFSMKDTNKDLEEAKSLLTGEYKLGYATNTCSIGLNGYRVAGNLKVRPSEKSKIIEKPFLFGILHEQVDFPLFSVVVQPSDFLQADV